MKTIPYGPEIPVSVYLAKLAEERRRLTGPGWTRPPETPAQAAQRMHEAATRGKQ